MHLVSLLTSKTRNDIGKHFFISVPEMGRPIYVVDGGRDIERLHGGMKSNTPPPFVEDFDTDRSKPNSTALERGAFLNQHR